MATIASVPVVDAQRFTCDPERTFAYLCKCGCDQFRVEVSTYANGDWAQRLLCNACDKENVVTEPLVNGLH